MKCPICGNDSEHAGDKNGYSYLRCKTCGLLFCATRVLPQHIRSQNLDALARHKPELEFWRLHRLNGEGTKTLKKVIDFGCGNGEFGGFLRREGINCLDIDLDTDLQLEDLADGFADGAVMLDVIEHLDCAPYIFRALRRVVKPGGILLVETVMSEDKGVEWNMCDPTVHHVQLHTDKSMRFLAEITGWYKSEKVSELNDDNHTTLYVFV